MAGFQGTIETQSQTPIYCATCGLQTGTTEAYPLSCPTCGGMTVSTQYDTRPDVNR